MKPKPNNFPREGQHQPVFAEQVRQFEKDRPVLNPTLDYTIGGEVEGSVHTNVLAEREYTIKNGHRILNSASHKLHGDHMASSGQARMQQIRARAEARRAKTQFQSNSQDKGHGH